MPRVKVWVACKCHVAAAPTMQLRCWPDRRSSSLPIAHHVCPRPVPSGRPAGSPSGVARNSGSPTAACSGPAASNKQQSAAGASGRIGSSHSGHLPSTTAGAARRRRRRRCAAHSLPAGPAAGIRPAARRPCAAVRHRSQSQLRVSESAGAAAVCSAGACSRPPPSLLCRLASSSAHPPLPPTTPHCPLPLAQCSGTANRNATYMPAWEAPQGPLAESMAQLEAALLEEAPEAVLVESSSSERSEYRRWAVKDQLFDRDDIE